MHKVKDDISIGLLNFERKYIQNMSLAAMGISLTGLVINIILGFSLPLILLPVFGFILYYGFYLWAKSGKQLFGLKLSLTFISYLLVNFIWYFNFGSHGPSPYFFVIIYSLLVFIWQKRQLLIVSILLVLNIAVICFIEIQYPNLIPNYPSNFARIVDSYTGLIIYGVILFVLVYSSKNYLFSEYSKAKKSDKLKSAFLANMSHEIRTPMNAIIGFSQMLDDPNLKEKDRAFYIETIQSQGDHLLSLINDIIDISKIESETTEFKKQNINVDRLIEDVIKGLQNRCHIGVELKFEKENKNTNLYFVSDYTRFRQVITNLVSNALKFTFEGSVTIRYNLNTFSQLELIIEDSGIGMEEKELDNIFERFYQIERENSQRLNEGTGIGLSITKAIVNQMKGRIEVKSALGVGSTFKVILPYVQGLQEAPINAETNRKLDVPTGKKILIVEDDEINYLYLKKLVESFGSIPFWTNGGQKAIDFLIANPSIDLVLLDMKMPVMSGYETAKIVKKLFPEIPIIAQTAYVLTEDRINAEVAGCNDFLAKPIKYEDLRKIFIKFLK